MSNPEGMTRAETIALFDSLPPARVETVLGPWTGGDWPTGHDMDGLLTASYWVGKRFEDVDLVHPLVHQVPFWGEICINPALLPVKLVTHLPMRDVILPVLFPVLAPLLRTNRPRARLREIAFRGRTHAAMIYDDKPIIDVFVEREPNELLGWMDMRGMAQPFFFTLSRAGKAD